MLPYIHVLVVKSRADTQSTLCIPSGSRKPASPLLLWEVKLMFAEWLGEGVGAPKGQPPLFPAISLHIGRVLAWHLEC